MKKSPYGTVLDVVGFLTGSVFNIVLTVIIIVLAVTFTQKYFNLGKEFVDESASVSGTPREVAVVVPEGADAMDIARILEENGLVNSKYYFYVQARLNGSYENFYYGTFKLNTGMTTRDIMDALKTMPEAADTNDVRITIPEGKNIKQIAELLESKELFSAADFLEACNSTEYNYDFLDGIKDRPNYLEGYLFPDTYFLSDNPTPEELIKKMLNRFDDVFDYDMRTRAAELGLTIDQVVIMASIIEREISVPNERILASSVIYNRLSEGMPLQMCSTVMYILDKQKDRLLETDLQIQSPYNTYINPGLPVGPIAGPGKASLVAALNPADTKDLYFVLKDEKTGEHFFTPNYDAFLQAKAQYNQKF